MTARLTFRTAGGTDAERAALDDVRAGLIGLDLAPWIFTSEIVIAQDVVPHSHPTLTLSTWNRGDFQLASLLHEQLHWFCAEHDERVRTVIDEQLRVRYPRVPVGRPDGARDEFSTYLHLIVCTQELAAMRRLVGRERADRVTRGAIEAGRYAWIYQTVVRDHAVLGTLLRSSDLLVDPD